MVPLQGAEAQQLAALHAVRTRDWQASYQLCRNLAAVAPSTVPGAQLLLRTAKLAALAQAPDSLQPAAPEVRA